MSNRPEIALEAPISRRRTQPVQRWVKRLIDLMLAGASLILLSPFLLAVAIAVKLTSRGPIFYRWEVLGENGRPFTGYKFRTMVVNADELKATLLERNEMTGPVFKMERDPRITPIGAFLRRFSIDELPQLWSVIKGDMSLVGPRPVGPQEWSHFEEWQKRKLTAVPGMICKWHIDGKPKDFEEWVKLDLEYIDNWSIWLDLRLLAGAAWYVISGKNH